MNKRERGISKHVAPQTTLIARRLRWLRSRLHDRPLTLQQGQIINNLLENVNLITTVTRRPLVLELFPQLPAISRYINDRYESNFLLGIDVLNPETDLSALQACLASEPINGPFDQDQFDWYLRFLQILFDVTFTNT